MPFAGFFAAAAAFGAPPAAAISSRSAWARAASERSYASMCTRLLSAVWPTAKRWRPRAAEHTVGLPSASSVGVVAFSPDWRRSSDDHSSGSSQTANAVLSACCAAPYHASACAAGGAPSSRFSRARRSERRSAVASGGPAAATFWRAPHAWRQVGRWAAAPLASCAMSTSRRWRRSDGSAAPAMSRRATAARLSSEPPPCFPCSTSQSICTTTWLSRFSFCHSATTSSSAVSSASDAPLTRSISPLVTASAWAGPRVPFSAAGSHTSCAACSAAVFTCCSREHTSARIACGRAPSRSKWWAVTIAAIASMMSELVDEPSSCSTSGSLARITSANLSAFSTSARAAAASTSSAVGSGAAAAPPPTAAAGGVSPSAGAAPSAGASPSASGGAGFSSSAAGSAAGSGAAGSCALSSSRFACESVGTNGLCSSRARKSLRASRRTLAFLSLRRARPFSAASVYADVGSARASARSLRTWRARERTKAFASAVRASGTAGRPSMVG